MNTKPQDPALSLEELEHLRERLRQEYTSQQQRKQLLFVVYVFLLVLGVLVAAVRLGV